MSPAWADGTPKTEMLTIPAATQTFQHIRGDLIFAEIGAQSRVIEMPIAGLCLSAGHAIFVGMGLSRRRGLASNWRVEIYLLLKYMKVG
jgi:hypothetical protein